MSTVTELTTAIGALLTQVDADLGAKDAQIAQLRAQISTLGETIGDQSRTIVALQARIAELEAQTPPPVEPEEPPTPTPTPTPTPGQVNVSNASQLTTALNNAKGGEVFVLASGSYGTVERTGKKFTTPVTIRAGTRHGAVFAAILLHGCEGWTLEGLRTTSRTRIDSSSKNMKVIDCQFPNGLSVNSSDQWRVERCDISGADNIPFITNHGTNGVLLGNLIHDSASDLVRIAGRAYNILMENNELRDVKPVSGMHPDALQVMVVDGVCPHHVTVRGNFIYDDPATGALSSMGMQGIFFNNPSTDGYRHIIIEQNLLLSGHTNAIFMNDGREGCIIRNNSLRSWKPDGSGGTIRCVNNCSGTVVEHNVMQSVINDAGATVRNNFDHSGDPTSASYYGKIFQPFDKTWRSLLPKTGGPIDFGTPYGAQARLKQLLGA
jgi:hypothetical protein